MIVSELMKREPQHVLVHDTVQGRRAPDAEENVGFLPVCDRRGRVLGTGPTVTSPYEPTHEFDGTHQHPE